MGVDANRGLRAVSIGNEPNRVQDGMAAWRVRSCRMHSFGFVPFAVWHVRSCFFLLPLSIFRRVWETIRSWGETLLLKNKKKAKKTRVRWIAANAGEEAFSGRQYAPVAARLRVMLDEPRVASRQKPVQCCRGSGHQHSHICRFWRCFTVYTARLYPRADTQNKHRYVFVVPLICLICSSLIICGHCG